MTDELTYPDGKWEVHSASPGVHHIVALESDWAIPLVAAGMTEGTAKYIVSLHNDLRAIAEQLAEALRENGSHVRKCEWCMGTRRRALKAWEIYNERK